MNAKTIRNAWVDAALAEHARTVDATAAEVQMDYLRGMGVWE